MTTKFMVANLETDKQLIVEEWERYDGKSPYRITRKIFLDTMDDPYEPVVGRDAYCGHLHIHNFFRVREFK